MPLAVATSLVAKFWWELSGGAFRSLPAGLVHWHAFAAASRPPIQFAVSPRAFASASKKARSTATTCLRKYPSMRLDCAASW